MGRQLCKQLEDNRRHQEHMGKVKKFTSWRTFTAPSKLLQSLDGDSNSYPEYHGKLCSMTDNADKNDKWAPYAGPGGWNG
uniref:Uncharacterized protein n=1 Tax=Aegilops tauschii subsp. strangulata TaxID=200361 RepID=A0A453KJK6_AEGTS